MSNVISFDEAQRDREEVRKRKLNKVVELRNQFEEALKQDCHAHLEEGGYNPSAMHLAELEAFERIFMVYSLEAIIRRLRKEHSELLNLIVDEGIQCTTGLPHFC